jgi:hypothetical protein
VITIEVFVNKQNAGIMIREMQMGQGARDYLLFSQRLSNGSERE